MSNKTLQEDLLETNPTFNFVQFLMMMAQLEVYTWSLHVMRLSTSQISKQERQNLRFMTLRHCMVKLDN